MDLERALPITHVTVFTGQARVERSGPLPSAGPGIVIVTDLPLLLIESSLQVRIDGAPLEVAELSLGWKLEPPEQRPVPELEARVREAERRLAAVMARKAELEQQSAFWSTVAPDPLNVGRLPAAGEDARDLPLAAEAWNSTLELVDGKLEAIHTARRALKRELQIAERELRLARDGLARASSTGFMGPLKRQVRIRTVEAPESGGRTGSSAPGAGTSVVAGAATAAEAPTGASPRITVSYLVPGASWAPSYEVRVSKDGLEAELAVRALVAQRTGEDWSGVQLSLSTADGRYTTELPVLPALRIGRAQPAVPRTGWRPPPEGLEALFSGYDRDRPPGLQAPAAKPAPPMTARATPARQQFTDEAGGLIDLAYSTMYTEVDEDDDLEGGEPLIDLSNMGGLAGTPKGGRGGGGQQELADSDGAPSLRRAPHAPAERSEPTFGAASMPPGAMPAPAPAMAKSAGPVQAARSMVESAKKRVAPGAPPQAAMALGGGGGGRRAQKPAPIEPAGLELRGDWLNYDALRLGGPGEPRRGELRPLDLEASLSEVLTDPAQVRRVVSEIHQAERDAQRIFALELPRFCQPVQQSRGRFEHRYDAAMKVALPSDGCYHALTLCRARGPAQIIYRTVPRVEPAVYRELVLSNPLHAPLLAGPADLYIGPDLVATSPLATVAEGGSIRLGLGIEERLKVARNTRYREVATGLLSGSLSLEHEILITLTSLLERTAEIEVLERIPVSNDADVEVKESASEPPATAYDQLERGQLIRGGRRFSVSLPGGRETTCRLVYKVLISSRNELIDGNRRD